MRWQIYTAPSDTTYHCRVYSALILSDSVYLEKCGEFDEGKSWEDDFTVIPYVQFLIMDAEIFNHYLNQPCDTILKNVPILYRYQLTLEDLQRMNWTVILRWL